VAAKKKEVDAIKKAWGSVKEPEKEYVALIDKELAEEMKAIKQMQQALDKKKETLEAEFKQQEDACKMVYKGMGGLRTVFSTLHRTADEVLKLLEKHLETMN